MPCSPAIRMMKVRPRFCQTVVAATANRAVSGSSSHCTGFSWPTASRNWLKMPIEGWNRTSHISEETATDVATVDEKIVRNTEMPRMRWWASVASASPQSRPRPTVMKANWNVTQRLWWKSDEPRTSRNWSKPTFSWDPKNGSVR